MIRTQWVLLLSIYTAISLNSIFAEEHAKNAPSSLTSQLAIPDSTQIQVLETTDGSTNIGRIVEIGTEEIAFKTDLGIIHIPISKIKHIETVSADLVRKGEFWFPNPNITRLFFAPTARMLKQGKGYFADYYLFFPGFAYGITDRFTLGGGLSIFPTVDINDQLFFLAPKFGLIQEKTFSFALGTLLVRIPRYEDEEVSPDADFQEDDPEVAGILYGVTTFGHPDASLTAGLGYGFVDGNLADRPMIMIGGEKRLTRRTAFVTENWIFPGIDEPLISYGIRFFGKRLSVDLGLINVIGEGAIFPGVPYIDFVVQF